MQADVDILLLSELTEHSSHGDYQGNPLTKGRVREYTKLTENIISIFSGGR